MAKVHYLKIKSENALSKLLGLKPYEVRINDRVYCVGDYVSYTCVDNDFVNLRIKDKIYMITSVSLYGNNNGFVVFSDREIR